MSQENVEIIRGMLDQGERGAATQREGAALWEILDDDVEFEVGALGIAGLTTFHGPDGVREFYLRWVRPFEEWETVQFNGISLF